MRIACLRFPGPAEIEGAAERALRFSPQICVSPQALFLEIGKCRRLYSEEVFLRKAAELFGRLGQSASIGLGDSLEWALLAAKFGTGDPAQFPVDGLFDLADPLLRDEKARPYVAKLVEALGRLGIHSLGQFRAVPRRELSARFGPVGLLCRQKLDGELATPWQPWTPPELIRETARYLHPEFQPTLEPLLFDAKKLLDRLFVRLRLRGLRAASLSLFFRCEKLSINPRPTRTLRIEFLLPQSETKGTVSILRDFLAKEFGPRPLLSPLEEFSLTVERTAPGLEAQKNLYHCREERRAAYAAFVSQLAQAHGKGSAYQAQTCEERLPEHSWEKVAQATRQADLKGRLPLRPTHLTRPREVRRWDGYLLLDRRRLRIRRWGEVAEKISARWLHGIVERTYYQVEVEGGPLLWVYREGSGKYFLHGFYG